MIRDNEQLAKERQYIRDINDPNKTMSIGT